VLIPAILASVLIVYSILITSFPYYKPLRSVNVKKKRRVFTKSFSLAHIIEKLKIFLAKLNGNIYIHYCYSMLTNAISGREA